MASDDTAPSSDGQIVFVRDVTLSPEDEPTTRREKLARIILDELYEFVGLLDADGRILEINRAALEGAGIRLDDIAGVPFWDARWWAVSGESRDEAREMVQRASGGEFVRRDVEVYGSAEGSQTIIVDYSLTPIRDTSGRVAFLLPEGRNITDKKRAEAELARRTEELQQLLDRVRQLDDAKSNFFANVSHELRTPLTLILGPTEELLGDEALDPDRRRNLEVVRRNALMLLKQVDALLDLAKIDAGEMQPNYVRLALGRLVRTAAAHFQALAEQRRITYIVEALDHVTAEVDPDKYERIVLNLLSNAFKFTPDDGWIRCRVEVSNDRQVLLTVQDSGPGVDPALRGEIFDRFNQGRSADRAGGTGLGLAIVKQFAELHGGTATLTDAPFGGALFQVELPRLAPPASYVRVEDPDAIGRQWTGDGSAAFDRRDDGLEVFEPRHPAPTVVVVEDHTDMRRFIVEALRDEWRVVSAASAERAFDAIRATVPDLVVTDLMMPRMSGEELVRDIRDTPALAQVPILVLSARSDDGLRVELLAGSVQDYVLKPFGAQELRARVRNLVTTKRARDALQAELDTHTGDLSVLTDQLIAGRRALQASHDALRRSEQRWRAVYESSATGIALLDLGGRVLGINPALRAMLDRDEPDVLGISVVDLCVPDERDELRAELLGLPRLGSERRRVQRRLNRGDGSILWVDASLSLAPGSADAEPMVVCVVEDVTERNEARAALAQAQNELARVTRATAMGALAASIAHEVNQPLAAISANAHACLRWLVGPHRDEAEAIAAAERIARDAERASEVIHGIRRFLGRGGSQREPVDVNDVVGDVVTLVAAYAEANGVTLECRLGELPVVDADRIQIEQVVVNLVTNGIEAMTGVAREQRSMLVETSTCDGAVVVRVVDRGSGIDAEREPSVFDAFHTTKRDGMGMGLAISRSIAEAHGGTLAVEHSDGSGTSMRFRLPVSGGGRA